MFFRIDTSKNYIEKMNIFETRQLMKPKTPNFPLTGTLRMRTVIKKTSIPFREIEAYNIFRSNPIKIKQ